MNMKVAPAEPGSNSGNELWELPAGWCWTDVTSIAWLRGERIDPQTAPDLPFVGMDDIESDGIKILQTKPFSTMKSAGNKFNAGDVLYGRLRPYLNKTALADIDGAASGELLAIVSDIDPRFLQLYLHTRRFVNQAMSSVSGDRPRIDFETIGGFQFPLAPLPEQRRIVQRVEVLLAEIAEGEAALHDARKGLEVFYRALLKAAVTGELTRDWRETNRPAETGRDLLVRIQSERSSSALTGRGKRAQACEAPDTAGLPELPEGWVWGTLAGLSWGSSYGTSVKCDPDANGPAILRIPNIRESRIVYDNLKYATNEIRISEVDFLAPGDLLVVRTNGSENLIGRAGVCLSSPEAATYFASYLIRFRLLGEEPLWRWVAWYLESPIARQWMMGQIASSAGQYNVSQSKLASLHIPVPPAPELTEILRRVSQALSAKGDTLVMLEAEASNAARLRQSILKSAFEGKLVDQCPDDEPASVLLARLKETPRAAPPRRRRRPAACA